VDSLKPVNLSTLEISLHDLQICRLFGPQALSLHQQDCISLEILELVFLVPLVISSFLVSETRANKLI